METGYYLKPSWKQRLGLRLGFTFPFDEELLDWRTEERENFVSGALITRVRIHISWMDLLRLLLSGRAEVEISTKTDKIIERAESRSRFRVCFPMSKE